MVYISTEERLGVPSFTATDAAARIPLGTRIRAYDPALGAGEFVYVRGVTGVIVGDAVLIDIATMNISRLAATNAVGPVAVAMSAPTAANPFCFVQVRGIATIRTAGAVAANADVYAAATGAVDDAVVAGEQIVNAKFTTAVGAAGTAPVALANPSIT